jgi:pimeloyl-ACP methyl ester carboxylesterase
MRAPDGVPIAYDEHGDGTPALVFVHGWSCDRSYWKAQVDAFGDTKVVAVYLAGHGASGPGRSEWTISAFGADVAAVVDALALERIVLIGHSMGGDVILEAARRLPGRVAQLVWVDVYSQLHTPRTPEQVEAFAAPFRDDFVDTTRAFVRRMFPSTADPSLVEYVAADMSSAPPAVALPSLAAALTFGREVPGILDELKLPTIAINGDTSPTDVESMHRHGVEVVVMSGVGHFLMMEDPERFNRLLAAAVRVH